MRASGDRFFRRFGSVEQLIERYFDVAYGWKLGRIEMRDMSLSELELYEQQTDRINEEMKDG